MLQTLSDNRSMVSMFKKLVQAQWRWRGRQNFTVVQKPTFPETQFTLNHQVTVIKCFFSWKKRNRRINLKRTSFQRFAHIKKKRSVFSFYFPLRRSVFKTTAFSLYISSLSSVCSKQNESLSEILTRKFLLRSSQSSKKGSRTSTEILCLLYYLTFALWLSASLLDICFVVKASLAICNYH